MVNLKQSPDLKDDLPDEPLVVIEPRRNSLLPNLREIWHFRELLQALVLRDIKVRYKQTLLGLLWAVIQPLSLMIVFSVVFGRLSRVPSDGIPYPLFAYAGLVPWTYFANAINSSGNSLVGNSSLITKIYFPRIIIPIAAVVSGLLDLAISFVLLVLLIIYYGSGFSISFLMLPILVTLTVLFAVGLGTWMSGLNVRYRDVRHALPFLIQIGMFVTPVIYPLSLLPEKWGWLLKINPLTGIIEGYRSAIFGLPFDWPGLGISSLFVLSVLLYSNFSFNQMERTFADVV